MWIASIQPEDGKTKWRRLIAARVEGVLVGPVYAPIDLQHVRALPVTATGIPETAGKDHADVGGPSGREGSGKWIGRVTQAVERVEDAASGLLAVTVLDWSSPWCNAHLLAVGFC